MLESIPEARPAVEFPSAHQGNHYRSASVSQPPRNNSSAFEKNDLGRVQGRRPRGNSDSIQFQTVAALVPAHVATPAPQPSPVTFSGPGGNLPAYEYYPPPRDDPFRRSQPSRNNDAQNALSSYLSQGPAATPQSYRPNVPTAAAPLSTPDGLMTPPSEKTTGEREYLSTEEEIHFFQVFIDDVAIWMDTLDKDRHFTNMAPYLALKSPMLLNALLACGVEQLTLVEGYNEEKAIHYYDAATKQLLRCLQNPERDTHECATAAVILNVYEIMSEKPAQRMSHIAGARALIRECGWDATTKGIGAACFWVNVGMEVLSCLAFNWQTAWDPDQWGLDLEFTNWTPTPRTGSVHDSGREGPIRDDNGDEELWVQRIFYIVAKITNFRANIPRFQEPSPHDEQVRRQSRFTEWKRLKSLCDAWNSTCPRSMQPYGYSHTPSSKSLFPYVWYVP